MSKVSKTARASMTQTVGQKIVISDETYVKNLRYDLANGLYVAQEGARALLRTYDALLAEKQAALVLLNQNLSGRKEEGGYKDLDDALRQLLQAYITNRDLIREIKDPQVPIENIDLGAASA